MNYVCCRGTELAHLLVRGSCSKRMGDAYVFIKDIKIEGAQIRYFTLFWLKITAH